MKANLFINLVQDFNCIKASIKIEFIYSFIRTEAESLGTEMLPKKILYLKIEHFSRNY